MTSPAEHRPPRRARVVLPNGRGGPARLRRALGFAPGLLVTAALLAALGGGALRPGRWPLTPVRESTSPERLVFAPAPRPAPSPVSRPAPRRSSPAPVAAPARPFVPAGSTPTAPTIAPTPADTGSGGAARPTTPVGLPAPGAEPGDRTPAAVPTYAPLPTRVGATREAPALGRAAMDSLLRAYAAAGDAGRLRPTGPPNADVGKLLAGRAITGMTVAERNDLVRAAMADEAAAADRSLGRHPGQPSGVPWTAPSAIASAIASGAALGAGGSLPLPIPGLGGPSNKRRARDRAIHAENLAILARVRDRTRRRADSLAWVAESTRVARAARDSDSSSGRVPH